MVYLRKSSSGHGRIGSTSGHTISVNRFAKNAYADRNGLENFLLHHVPAKEFSSKVTSREGPMAFGIESSIVRVLITI